LKNKFGNIREKYRSIKEIKRNIISTLFTAIISLFIGLLIIYIVFHLIPGDVIAAQLAARGISNPSEPLYLQFASQLGFEYNPIFGRYILRFSIYLSEFFVSDWGHSISLHLVTDRILANNTILHLVLIGIIPMILGTIFMIKKSRKKTILFNTLVVMILLSAAFIFYVGISSLFNLRGFGKLIVDSFATYDHYLAKGCLFLVLIMYISVLLSSNMIFSVYNLRSSKTSEESVKSNSNWV
jgi:ABC-type dipeptide/oligopeptide/nickel transport system permease component